MEYSYGKKSEFLKGFYTDEDFVVAVMGDGKKYSFVDSEGKRETLLFRMEKQFKNIDAMIAKNTGAIVVGATGITIPVIDQILIDRFASVIDSNPFAAAAIIGSWGLALGLFLLFKDSLRKQIELNKIKYFLDNKDTFSKRVPLISKNRNYITDLLFKLYCGTMGDGKVTINNLDNFTKADLVKIKEIIEKYSEEFGGMEESKAMSLRLKKD